MREHRPRDLSPPEIGFTPQPAVQWLNPGLLLGTAVRVVMAYLFGGYLDKRELQAGLPDSLHDYADQNELWLDYTADVGDGFDATYSIAYQLAQPSLEVENAGELRRGDILVLGGDQVYPTASAKGYEDRWKGPYRAALPELGPDSPTIYALPGNHDWYDGLTAFLRLFAQDDPVGGWHTAQGRSYFALKLPHNWWLFALDTQLDAYIDEPQLRYFAAAAQGLGPSDRVILTTPRPFWVMTPTYPRAYDSLDYFVRTIIEPTGARIPLMLAGDYHHYARYAGGGPDGLGRQLVTCGGGGAYLVGTAHLPDTVSAPPPDTPTRAASEPQPYALAGAYPSKEETRRLDWRIFTRLPTRNRGFVALVGLMQTLLMLAFMTSHGRWLNAVIGFAVAAVLTGTVLFATVMGQRGLRQWIAGLLHGVPHVALGVAGAAVWSSLPFVGAPPPWSILLAFVVYLPVIGVIDSWIVGAYLLAARYAHVNINELYAGIGLDDYKSFLRMHLGRDGSLTIYPIVVDKVARRWRANPHAPRDAPWIVPDEDIRVRLAEPPITLT